MASSPQASSSKASTSSSIPAPKKLNSCDACRSRKIRCDRILPAEGSSPSDSGIPPPCKQCGNLGIECTTTWRPKRRGPPSEYLKKRLAAEAQAQAQSHSTINGNSIMNNGLSPSTSNSISIENLTSSPGSGSASASISRVASNPYPHIQHPPPSHPYSPNQQQQQQQQQQHYPYNPQHNYSPDDRYKHEHHNHHQNNIGHPHSHSPNTVNSQSPISHLSPQSHFYYQSNHNNNLNYNNHHNYSRNLHETNFNSLENVLSRDVAMYIFSLFFDYVHPLTPCLHRPTFLMEVEARRDEKDPVFLALVLSVLASAMVQIPKALLPPINGVPARDVANRCYQVSRLVSLSTYDPPTIELVITRFLDAVYHLVSGRLGAQAACLGEALQLGVSLGLHRESSYVGLDPISTEVRRRMFALIFTSDKSAACLRDRPIFITTEECDTLMPKEVDDDYITRTEYLEYPVHATSTIAGFNIVTRIFKIVGHALVLRRAVRRELPLTPESILSYLRRIETISEDLKAVLQDIPSALKLEDSSAPLEIPETNQEWGQDILAQLDVYFSQAYQTRSIAKESFLVLKGNIYVTHALARYVLLKCRNEIIEQANPDGTDSMSATARFLSLITGRQDRYEDIILDLLQALHSIPIQNLAVNGPSLVNKVRYVAVALLDALDSQNPVSREGAYLLDFLGILSEIEQTL